MPSLVVSDAAAELGVSQRRVRQMLASGELQGDRVGRSWILSAEEVERASRRGVDAGRRWNAASAWAVLCLAAGDEVELSPVERSRAKQRLAGGLESLIGRLSSRAHLKHFYAHPGVLDYLADAPAVVRGGVSAAAEYDAGLMVVGEFEGYVRDGDLDELISRFALDESADRHNVSLRIVPDHAWPFAAGQAIASMPVVAVDLLEADDPRARRAGAELLEKC